MSLVPRPFLAAAVQAAPVFLDRDATVEKACGLIAGAAREGARLIVLPETFVPAYPAWVWLLPPTRRADLAALYRDLVEQSVTVPGPEVERLGRAARDACAWVAIGVNERNAERSGTTRYSTLLMYDDEGRLVSRHRKLMPTGAERLVWTQGERADLKVHDTPLGRLSGLICWENYMPLARYALYAQGAQIHLAPTWDKSVQWIASMCHVAREARAWVIGCCQALHRDHVPDRLPFKDAIPRDAEWINVGNSLIVDPEGVVVAGPLAGREGILCAEIDQGRAAGSRWIFHAAGHYSRPDLFEFAVREPGGPTVRAAGRGVAPAHGPLAHRVRSAPGRAADAPPLAPDVARAHERAAQCPRPGSRPRGARRAASGRRHSAARARRARAGAFASRSALLAPFPLRSFERALWLPALRSQAAWRGVRSRARRCSRDRPAPSRHRSSSRAGRSPGRRTPAGPR